MSHILGRRNTHQTGAILLESVVGLFMLTIATLAFLALFPVIHRSQVISRQESIATQLSSRMLEHLQTLRPADITASTLTQLNLVDPNQSNSPYTFSHVPLDEASGYSPAQALKHGTGRFIVTDMGNNSVKIDLEVAWVSPTGKSRSIQTGTILGGYR